MGTNTLNTKSDGDVVESNDPNQYKTALANDFLPRNSSGKPTDLAGSLGTTDFRWAISYLKSVVLGAIASGLSIEEDDGDIVIKVGGSEASRIGANGLSGLAPGAVEYANLGPLNYEQSSEIGPSGNIFSTSSTSAVDIPNSSVSITTNGRPCLIILHSIDGNTSVPIASGAIRLSRPNGDAAASIYLNIDGSNVTHTGMRNGEGSFLEIPSITFFNALDAGSHTIKLQVEVSNSAAIFVITRCVLTVIEL